MEVMVFLNTVTLVLMNLKMVTCMTIHNVYWNTSNPIFRIDNTQHIVDVNQGNLPWEYDQVNIVCPVYKTDRPSNEKHIIYSVSKEEFDTCRVSNKHPKIVAVCDQPQTSMYFTISFRSFSPTPGGLEFSPGNHYFFSTTTTDLDPFIGNWCRSHNMKMIFRVADNGEEQVKQDLSENIVPSPSAWAKFWNPKTVQGVYKSRVLEREGDYIYQYKRTSTHGTEGPKQQRHGGDEGRGSYDRGRGRFGRGRESALPLTSATCSKYPQGLLMLFVVAILISR